MPIVAVLHDVVEDCGVGLEEIAMRFGICAKDGVEWLTKATLGVDPYSASRANRRQVDLEKISYAPTEWKIVKAYDRIDNLLSMQYAPKDFTLKIYIPESRDLLTVLQPDLPPGVITELKAAIIDVRGWHLGT